MDVADGCACWTSLEVIHGVVHFDGVGDLLMIFAVFPMGVQDVLDSFWGSAWVQASYCKIGDKFVEEFDLVCPCFTVW